MRNVHQLFLAGALLLAGSASSAAEYAVDSTHTHIGFTVRHILTRLPGRFREVQGTFSFNPKAPEASSGTFSVKAASIDTNMEKRDEHLRGQDFFWAEKYPELTLKVRKLTPTGKAGSYAATTDLTIRGVTKSVVLTIEYLGAEKSPWGQNVASFEARATINRKDFGLAWNKALESGGVLVGDEVQLILDVEGVEAVPQR